MFIVLVSCLSRPCLIDVSFQKLYICTKPNKTESICLLRVSFSRREGELVRLLSLSDEAVLPVRCACR